LRSSSQSPRSDLRSVASFIVMTIVKGQLALTVSFFWWQKEKLSLIVYFFSGHCSTPISACFMIMAALMVLLLKFLLIRENWRRDRLSPKEFAKESEGSEHADRHPRIATTADM